MKKFGLAKGVKFCAFLMFAFFFSEGHSTRFRTPSLDMGIDVFTAHWWLDFEEKAFDKKWLKQKIACHFDENNDSCHYLAPLLRMYAFAETSNKRRQKYAQAMFSKLSFNREKQTEVELFLIEYCDDTTLIPILKRRGYEISDEIDPPETFAQKIENLHSQLNAIKSIKQAEAMSYLAHKNDRITTHPDFFEFMVKHSATEKKLNEYLVANIYLMEKGYLAYFDLMAYDFADPEGIISITGATIDKAEYLANYSISNSWKFHANSISLTQFNHRNFSTPELLHFFEKIQYSTNSDLKEKIAFIRKTQAFKETSSSMKFIIGDGLMYKNHQLGIPILEQAFKQGNNAMKSAIVARYPEHFKVKPTFWKKLKAKSNDIELILVEQNHKFWKERIERL